MKPVIRHPETGCRVTFYEQIQTNVWKSNFDGFLMKKTFFFAKKIPH